MPRQVVVVNGIDCATEARIGVDYAHHEIHCGSAFQVSDLQAINTTTVKWLLTTPATKRAHILFNVDCTGEVALTVTEGADRAGTTPITPINRLRESAAAATVTVHRGISGGTTDGATTIISVRSGATGQGAKTIQSGGHRGLNEFVLKPSTKYVIAVQTFAAVYATLLLDWYENGV